MEKIVSNLRSNLGKHSRSYKWRIIQLKALKQMLIRNEAQFAKALWQDLRKSEFEYIATEKAPVIAEIDYAIKNLKNWMKPDWVPTPLFNLPGKSEIYYQPYGLVLIIGAWNYPVNLLLSPLVAAIAAGNAVVLKPSELSKETEKLIAELIPRYLDSDLIQVVLAGPEDTSKLLDEKFDSIFFTGSTAVGKIVMSKAAFHLTPVTLELGGKSPAIVLDDADIAVAARRLTWGKFLNAGQTCVAPDYILVAESVKEKLISEIKTDLNKFFGADASKSSDYGRIVNPKNFERLVKLVADSKIILGGRFDAQSLFIEPSLLDADFSSEIMKEEIFGPLLPIITVKDLNAAIEFVNSRPKPLSLYIFSKSKESQNKVIAETSSGGLCINDVIVHMSTVELPFGGVGASGTGSYHGYFGFKTFSHTKSVMTKSNWFDVPLRYPPFTLTKSKWINRIL